MKVLVISVSDVAACIGSNKHENSEKLLLKYSNKLREQIGKKKEISNEDELLDLIDTKYPKLSDTVDKIIMNKDFYKLDNLEISKIVEYAKVEIYKEILPSKKSEVSEKSKVSEKSELSEVSEKSEVSEVSEKSESSEKSEKSESSEISVCKKEEILKEFRSKIHKKYGTVSEEKTSKKIMTETSTTLVEDKKYYTESIWDNEDIFFILRGRVDRIETTLTGEKILIEIKNRMYKLYSYVPKYELIQVQIYLKMLDLENAKLVEQYRDEIYTHKIKRNAKMYNEVIMPQLIEFCKKIYDNITSS